MAEIDARILEAASVRVGILSRAELRVLGCSNQQIERRVADGRLVRVHPATFRVASAPMGWVPEVRAAVAAAGPVAGTSHRAGARIWELDGARGSVVDIVVPRGARRRIAGVRVHESLDFDQSDITERGGIAVTTIERTLVDVAWPAPYLRLEQMVDDAVRKGLTTYPRVLHKFLSLARQGRPGVVKMRALLDARAGLDVRIGNYFENLVLDLVRRAGIELPVMQHPVTVGGNSFSLDLAWIAQRLAVECDGWDSHGTPQALEADLRRQNLLILDGWTVLRFAYRTVVEHPDKVAAQIRSAMRRLS